MTLPNFLILGAAKSGTTTLYHWLAQHPEIGMPALKEPYFFASYKPSAQSIRGLDAYRSLFEGCAGAPLVGEASAGYLYCPDAPGRIRELLGADVRMLAVLRHPVDRAYSMYWHRRRDAEEPLSFEEAIAAEPDRIEAGWQLGWHYMAMGRYGEQLRRYYALFPREQILVQSFDDLRRAPQACLREATDFLGVAPFPRLPEAENENPGYTIRVPGIERFIRTAVGGPQSGARRFVPAAVKRAAKSGLRRINRKGSGYQGLERERRRELSERFREDIEYLAREVRPGFRAWAAELP